MNQAILRENAGVNYLFSVANFLWCDLPTHLMNWTRCNSLKKVIQAIRNFVKVISRKLPFWYMHKESPFLS